ncbi:nuclear transport factor 2 family protein [Paraburkholderia caribensis]|uniref:nuclear transport factor 2 family protein n=1 Tax=Paraburkholderia caribensis TaxID=75105 RepID=UPI0006D43F0A|nr:nuclear transport factor 2 family protein [Paraburkholderia caribensis]ALP65178.1 ketosteroid isomerase [Paraburkholderia caribensis]AUT53671.1 nuclear transport factor 2 family protein [Paraburkholderia caribensis]
MSKATDVPDLVRRAFAAYQHKDRAAIEAILAADFHFTSPRDDHIDRREYFERCWPFNGQVEFFQIEKLFSEGDEAFVRYACKPVNRGAFRNTEFFRVENGKIVEVQVYFGSPAKDVSAD